MAYRYECIKSNKIINNVPYEVRAINFYANAASKKIRRKKLVSLHSPYSLKMSIDSENIINDFEGTYERRWSGDKTKGGHRIRRKN